MANNNNVIKAWGVSFDNDDGVSRQSLIEKLEVGDFVHFVEEPTNPKDALAIAIVNDSGETLGYIGTDDPMREDVRRAMKYSNFMATISEVTGRYPNAKKTYTQGLRIAVGNVIKDGDDEPDFAPLFRSEGKRRTDRYFLEKQHKVNDLRDLVLSSNNNKKDEEWKRVMTHRARRKFKQGLDLDARDLGWKYDGYTKDEWIAYRMAKYNKRMASKVSEEYLDEMERKLWKTPGIVG